jgi:hypothetical protein
VVTNSILRSDDSALKFGTAGYTGIQNTLFSNIIIRESRFGIALFQMDGGAYLNNRFENISIETGGRGPRQFAIYADIDRRTADADFGRIEGLSFRNIEVHSGGNILIGGQSEQPIRGLTIDGLTWRTPATLEVITPERRKPRGNTLLGYSAVSEDYANVPSMITLANVEGASVQNLDISIADPISQRSFLSLIQVRDATFMGLDFANAAQQTAPAVMLRDTDDVSLSAIATPRNVTTFLSASGANQGSVWLHGANLAGVDTPWTVSDGACITAQATVLPSAGRRAAERSLCRR